MQLYDVNLCKIKSSNWLYTSPTYFAELHNLPNLHHNTWSYFNSMQIHYLNILILPEIMVLIITIMLFLALKPGIFDDLVNINSYILLRILSSTSNDTIKNFEFMIISIAFTIQDKILLPKIYRWPASLLFNTFTNKSTKQYPNFWNIILNKDMNCDLLPHNFEAYYHRDVTQSLAHEIISPESNHHIADRLI